MGCLIRVRVLHPQANAINTPKALLRAKTEGMSLICSFISHLRPDARWGREQWDQTCTNKMQIWRIEESWATAKDTVKYWLLYWTKPRTFTWVQKNTLGFVQTWLSVMGIYLSISISTFLIHVSNMLMKFKLWNFFSRKCFSLHQRPPPISSTNILLQHPPSTSSINIFHQQPLSSPSINYLRKLLPSFSFINILN